MDSVYLDAAREFADVCVDNGIHALYGGGAVGLMGVFANRVLERQGKITGIIPDFMMELEWAHVNVPEMVVVEDMRERKRRLIENVDAVVALPGGIGTLEEFLEVSTLKQLGQFNKPIIIINTQGFYDTLLRFIDELIEKKFMHDYNRKIWEVIDSPVKFMSTVNHAMDWDAAKINKGAL